MKHLDEHTKNLVDCINIAANSGHNIESRKAEKELLTLVENQRAENGFMTVWVGEVQVSGHINKLKDLANILEESTGMGLDRSNNVSDCLFSIDAAYQAYHELDEDNWSTVH